MHLAYKSPYLHQIPQEKDTTENDRAFSVANNFQAELEFAKDVSVIFVGQIPSGLHIDVVRQEPY